MELRLESGSTAYSHSQVTDLAAYATVLGYTLQFVLVADWSTPESSDDIADDTAPPIPMLETGPRRKTLAVNRPGRNLSQRNARLLAARNAGTPVVELSREFGLSLSWTGALLRKLGADMPESGRGFKRQLDQQTVIDQYESGLPVREVAELNDVSYGYVYRLLRAAGIPMRPRGGKTT
ncbi:helix-turn-helix domain-containing protein [Amycolatopsis iheyensis]|uniref:helix-turn-helix domain-containing protein n=1 Tax=Amycolatopsis iheyensis TaxID=2945988 RepID=UPI003558A55C